MKNITQKLWGATAAFALAGVLFTSTQPLTAADGASSGKPASEESKQETKFKRYPFRGKLGAFDKKEKTITIHGKEKDRVFHIVKETKIEKHGKPATLEDAVVGEEIAGLTMEKPDGRLELVSLRMGPKPEEKSATAKPAKADSKP